MAELHTIALYEFLRDIRDPLHKVDSVFVSAKKKSEIPASHGFRLRKRPWNPKYHTGKEEGHSLGKAVYTTFLSSKKL